MPLDLVHCHTNKIKAISGLRTLIPIQLDCMKWETLRSIAVQRGESVEEVEKRHRDELRAAGWTLAEDTIPVSL